MTAIHDRVAWLFFERGSTFPIYTRHSFLGIPFKRRRGYLWITRNRACLWPAEEKENIWALTVASGKRTHQPLDGPLYGIDLKMSDGTLTAAYKTLLSLHLIRDPKEAKNVFEHVENCVRLVYDAEQQDEKRSSSGKCDPASPE